MDKCDLFIEEYKLLQSIIARQDGIKSQTRRLAVTLVGATSALFFSTPTAGVSSGEYVLIVSFLSMMFWIIESIFGATEMAAELRVRELESIGSKICSLECDAYDGPKIHSALVQEFSKKTICKAAFRERTYLIYLALFLFAVVIACFAA